MIKKNIYIIILYYMYKLFIEALVVGIMTVVVGTIVSLIVKKMNIFSVKLPDVCKDWNNFYIMEICLFFTGFTLHLLCELFGINKYYCNNSYACNKK